MMVLRNILRKKQAYASCSVMPLSVFLGIIYQEIPEPTNWEEIFQEYQELSKTKQSNVFLSLSRDIVYTDNKIYIIESCLNMIGVCWNADIASVLNGYYPKIKYPNDPEQLRADISKTRSLLKSLKLKNNDNKSTLTKMQKEASKNVSKKTDWDIQLSVISKYMGYKIDPRNTMVSEYCALINLYNEAVKANGK